MRADNRHMSASPRRRAALVAVWLGGSFLAIAVAVAAIGLAGARVTASTTMVRAHDAAQTLSTVVEAGPGDATSVPPAGDDPTTVVPGEGSSAERSAAGPVVVGPGGSVERPDSSPTTESPEAEPAPPAASPTTAAPAPPPTTPQSPSSTKTVAVVGGTVKVQCINSSLTLVSAVPNAGFEVEVGNHGPQQIEVQFNNDTHQSDVTANCRAGVITFSTKESAGGA